MKRTLRRRQRGIIRRVSRRRKKRRPSRSRRTLRRQRVARLIQKIRSERRRRKQRRRRKKRTHFRLTSRPFLIRHRSSSSGKTVDRLAVVTNVNGKNIAFYRSTGTGSPGLVQRNTWVPFNGISRKGGGWFVKMPGKLPVGDLEKASHWLRKKIKIKTASRIFDENDFSSLSDWNNRVNTYIHEHGALYPEGGGPFLVGTVNYR